MLKERKFLGWAAYEGELLTHDGGDGVVVLFESDYASRSSVEKNVARCINAAFNADAVPVHVAIYKPDDGERMMEEARYFCGCNSGFKVQQGCYPVSKSIKTVSTAPAKSAKTSSKPVPRDNHEAQELDVVADIAHEFGAMKETIKALFDAFMEVQKEGYTTYQEARTDFRNFYSGLVGDVAVS